MAQHTKMDSLYAAELAKVEAVAASLDAGERNAHVAEPFRTILNNALSVRSRPSSLKIITDFVYPPIPVRTMDWSAVTDNYDGADDSNDPIGWGATEAEAVNDLLDQICRDRTDEVDNFGGCKECGAGPSEPCRAYWSKSAA